MQSNQARKFVVAVKDATGEWTTITAIEMKISEPVVVFRDGWDITVTGSSLPVSSDERG